MKMILKSHITLLSFLLLFLLNNPAMALSEVSAAGGGNDRLRAQIDLLVLDDSAGRADILKAWSKEANPATLPILTAMDEGILHVWTNLAGVSRTVLTETVELTEEEEIIYLLDPLTRERLGEWDDTELDEELDMVTAGSAEGRRWLRTAIDHLKLFDPSEKTRRAAAVKIGNRGDPAALPLLEKARGQETDRWTGHAIDEAIGQIHLDSTDAATRREAAEQLGKIKGLQAFPKLQALLSEEPGEPDPAVRQAIQEAIREIEAFQQQQQITGVIFSGISLGSILLLMGIGLAITFGLMGVINMAHGEMMMIGAYTAFVVQEIFSATFSPAIQDFYFIVALPLSLIFTGMVGFGLEKGIIRHLYGRPLETLLATWGVSLILQQAARWYFGDLTSVNAPSLLQGGIQIMVGLVIPYNRIFIIVLSALCLVSVYYLLFRTQWGLRIRAVTQNREMSACLGISTRKVDSWTFALGAGLAGLAGCALSLVGSVDPEMGKTYIVDSFMVVVVGGVGNLLGTIFSAMGIGMLNKVLEPIIGGTGGVIYAKLTILALVILFLQRKPSGLFPAKGRAAEVNQ